MVECANADPKIIKNIITGDEIWVYGYDPEIKSMLLEKTWTTKSPKNKHGNYKAMRKSC